MERELEAVKQLGSYTAKNSGKWKVESGKLCNVQFSTFNFQLIYTSIITAILSLFLTLTPAFAEDLPMSALVTPTNVDFKICTRNYIMPEEKLFYMAIASARANNFDVNEIQSKTGYILFTAAGKQYLASVLKVDNKNSMLKITPVNNNYFFAPGIVLNFFRYIDLNGATPIVDLPKG